MTTHDASHTDLLDALNRAISGTDRLIVGIDVRQWSALTPCTEWDVRALVTHVTSGMLTFAALVRGDPRPDHAADHLTDDPVAAYRSAATTMRAAFAAPGALDRTYPSPIGPAPGSVLVPLRITELLVHGWDLAQATGQQSDVPADLAEGELALWRAQFRHGLPAGLPFAAAQTATTQAPAIDQLAAFLGRSV
jgi:uncharacterized protein (TIGR03086 family)